MGRKLFITMVKKCKMGNKWNRKWATTMQKLVTNSEPNNGMCPSDELSLGARGLRFDTMRNKDEINESFDEMITLLINQNRQRSLYGESEMSKTDRKKLLLDIMDSEDEEPEDFAIPRRMAMDVSLEDETHLKFNDYENEPECFYDDISSVANAKFLAALDQFEAVHKNH